MKTFKKMPIHPQAIFFLKIGSIRAKSIRKYVPVLQVGKFAPGPAPPHIIACNSGTLFHTERIIQYFFEISVLRSEMPIMKKFPSPSLLFHSHSSLYCLAKANFTEWWMKMERRSLIVKVDGLKVRLIFLSSQTRQTQLVVSPFSARGGSSQSFALLSLA